MKVKKNESVPETVVEKPSLILKSGDTDLRRGAKALKKLIETTGYNPNDGNMYGFYNMQETAKFIQHKKDGDAMLTKKRDVPVNIWPKYQPQGAPGYMVTLTGKDKDDFLGRIGCPREL
ncbi:MAG: hypothetical protein LBS55_13270 [Prevotellaceae bacterium]|jgi:hypothetical protein|nr:hypothetical protein [Prevotellaceae bacterium]